MTTRCGLSSSRNFPTTMPPHTEDAAATIAEAAIPAMSRNSVSEDFTSKITVDGLEPGTRYHYRFIAPDGSMSPVGQTRTLPADDAKAWRAAIFSCSDVVVKMAERYCVPTSLPWRMPWVGS